MATAQVKRIRIDGVHVSMWRYGSKEWSFTIFGPRETQELLVKRMDYWKAYRTAKLMINLYHK